MLFWDLSLLAASREGMGTVTCSLHSHGSTSGVPPRGAFAHVWGQNQTQTVLLEGDSTQRGQAGSSPASQHTRQW